MYAEYLGSRKVLSMPLNENKKIIEFLFEMGDLKRVKRSGWWHCKIKDPESVAEHSFRTAIIAFALAKLEKFDSPEKISFLALIHDLPESRLTDLHKVSASYIENKNEIEAKILSEQEKKLGFSFPKFTPEEKALIKDADLLEMAFMAREYLESGYANAQILFSEAGKKLKYGASKSLYFSLKTSKSTDWWVSISRK
jgi:putative hydrolases of HD superfamily